MQNFLLADMIVIAPATANIIAKFATGLADDLISTILLASNVPLLFAPAMNCEMWQKKVVQEQLFWNHKKAPLPVVVINC